jgi:hypothetical protein
MFETLLIWLTAAFVVVAVLSVVGIFVARWVFLRIADRVARTLDRRVGGAAARGLTRLSVYAHAHGIDVAEADRRFGQYIDGFARLMDSAVRLPLIGPVGLDAVISLFPVVGDLVAGALSLTLVGRSLRYGPLAAIVSRMLANVFTDMILGAIPFVGVLADIWFKANDRNAALMREFLESHGTAAGQDVRDGTASA